MQENYLPLWKRLRQNEVRVLVTTEAGVLLLKRPRPVVWEMPGGAIDPGETPEEAARRETEEETGLQVRLTGLLGTFQRGGWLGGTVYLYRAEAVDGQLVPNEEAWELDFFQPGQHIRLMLPWHRPYWALAQAEPSEEVQVQRVRTWDVCVMMALHWTYRWGLVRDERLGGDHPPPAGWKPAGG